MNTSRIGQAAMLTAACLGLWMAGRARARRREPNLGGQSVLVTGGSRGLGFLLAREFARESCRVAICARVPEELERAQRELAQQGAKVSTVVCDVADPAQVTRMVEEVTTRFGRLDILVNNAGIIQVGPAHTMTLQDFREAMDINFWGTLYTIYAVLPQMRQRRSGRIVNITSLGGKVSVPHLLPYSCSKFAAVGLSEGLRAELARDGVHVTTIAPGLMRTGSYLNAEFKGEQNREYTVFGLSATLPLITLNAEKAARQVVEATRRGEAERLLGLPANAAATFHGLFPGLTADLLGVINEALPSAEPDEQAKARGAEVEPRVRSRWLDVLMTLGRIAVERLNERPGPVQAQP